MRTRIFALPTAAALLLLTGCGGGEGLGNSDALDDLELHIRDDDQPEVILHAPVDSDEGASQVLEAGDGEQVKEDSLLEVRQVAASPESGDVMGHNFDTELPQIAWLPSMEETGMDIDQFYFDALTAEGVTVGSDVAVYYPADEEGAHDQQLAIFRLEDQYPAYADGEVQEPSGDLPEVTNEIGEAPELQNHDSEAEAPGELATEELIAGEGREINDDDQLFVQYRGWQWQNGEQFDGSWTEDGEAGQPFGFSLTGGVIEGWMEGIPGNNVGDRLMMVIPQEQAYGEAVDDEGLTEGGQPGGPLIFTIDIVQAISPDDLPEPQQQPQQQPMPEDMSEEELQEMLDQMEEQQQGGQESPQDETEEDGSQ